MTGTITVVHGKTVPESVGIWIDRRSPIGNPYAFTNGTKATTIVGSRDAACDAYAMWIVFAYATKHLKTTHGQAKIFLDDLIQRYENGEDLILKCWCKPQRCHGDTVRRFIEVPVFRTW